VTRLADLPFVQKRLLRLAARNEGRPVSIVPGERDAALALIDLGLIVEEGHDPASLDTIEVTDAGRAVVKRG
jgi:hypothetical protein